MQPKVKTFASPSEALTPWEKNSRQVAYQAAVEGIVLLKNDGALPVRPGRIALYGAGGSHTIKGGTGSGEVNERHAMTIEEGLKAGGFTVTTQSYLRSYDRLYEQAETDYETEFRRKLKRLSITGIINLMNNPFSPPVAQPITQADIDDSDTEVCLYVVARQAGEGSDRKLEKFDYRLTEQEYADISLCAKRYDRFAVVINVGSSFDMGFLDEIPGINAVIFYAQQGGMGGLALADLLSGKETPSGKLADTWAMNYEDIPFAKEYSYLNGDLNEEYYKEGIYVGYRYFDTFGVAPRYPFGYGLSYTQFSTEVKEVRVEQDKITVVAAVTNTGTKYPGKEILQLYVSCPQSKELPKEYQRLAAFGKTRLLQPGDTQTLEFSFRAEAMASFRERDGVTVLEAGEYLLRLGGSSRDTQSCAIVELDEETVISRHQHICWRQTPVDEIRAPAVLMGTVDACILRLRLRSRDIPTAKFVYADPPIDHSDEVEKRMQKLSVNDMIKLTVGGGMVGKRYFDAPGAAGSTTGRLLGKGIPNVSLADGPAGLRLQKRSVLLKNGKLKPVDPAITMIKYLPGFIRNFLTADPAKGQVLYQFTTAFPVELALAQSWNTALLEQVGEAVSSEMSAYGVSYWLAPAMNIHRNPLCGRNFEYFSEDPLLSGKFAAAITRGVQSIPGNYATIKHFACNNQEDNRNRTNANVSERALREIYLRGFGIAVKESQPGAVMSSYNKLNGVYTPNSHDLQTKLLRNEWDFKGFVMTDWYSTGRKLGDHAQAIKAGNDLIMPGGSDAIRRIKKELKRGNILQSDVRRCAGNVLRGILSTTIGKAYYEE